jgi:hypothetical protein
MATKTSPLCEVINLAEERGLRKLDKAAAQIDIERFLGLDAGPEGAEFYSLNKASQENDADYYEEKPFNALEYQRKYYAKNRAAINAKRRKAG